MPETDEERRIRKEKERAAGGGRRETEEERRIRKEKERAEGGGRRETEEERRIRKEKERAEGGGRRETDEERRIRKEKERAEGGGRRETDEERRIRKEKERAARGPETEEQRRARKERERAEREGGGRRETEEERRIRKEKERAEGGGRRETEEERRIRKEKERAAQEGGGRRETDEERRIRKEKERAAQAAEAGKRSETADERRERKAREARDREEAEARREKREVVHKPLPTSLAQRSSPQAASGPVRSSVPTSPPPQPPQQAAPKPPVMNQVEEEEEEEYGDDFEEVEPEKQESFSKSPERRQSLSKFAMSAIYGGRTPEARKGMDMTSMERQKQRELWDKQYERASGLRRLIDLDLTTMQVADFPPMTEYDMFIRKFGGVNQEQQSVQAPHPTDVVSDEVQTDRIHARPKECQAPDDLGLVPERQVAMKDNGSGNAQAASGSATATGATASSVMNVNTTVLGSFLTRVFPVFRSLLDENELQHRPQQASKSSSMPFSSTFTSFNFPPVANRPVSEVRFCQCSPQYFVSVHTTPSTTEGKPGSLDEFGTILLVWNTHDTVKPLRVLGYHGEVTSVCFSPTKVHLIYGGTAHGSMVLWDTREADHAHKVVGGFVVRIPSYTTDWLQVENHTSGVKRIRVVGYNSSIGQRKELDSEQVASVDGDGVVHFWLLSEVQSKSSGVKDNDYGVGASSVVRLFKAVSVSVTDDALVSTSDLDLSPKDPGTFVVASTAAVHHGSRFGTQPTPAMYNVGGAGSFGLTTSPVTSIQYCPTDSRLIAASYEDGSIRLFKSDATMPVLTISPRREELAIGLQWSPIMKNVLMVLTSLGSIVVYDFAVRDRFRPVVSSGASVGNSAPTWFDLSFEAETKMAIGYDNGHVDVHTMNSNIYAQPKDRNERWV